MRDLVLIAASGLAREILASRQHIWRIVGILDDDESLRGVSIGGVTVIGGVSTAAHRAEALLICAGAGSTRRSILRTLTGLGVANDRYATLVDEAVRIPDGCSVQPGSILLAGVVLTANVAIGRHVVVMPNCVLTHDAVLEDFVTLASGSALGGGVRLGEASYVGMNAGVRQGVTVGADSIIGMGSVVLHDVPDGETWAGVPAGRLAPSLGLSGARVVPA